MKITQIKVHLWVIFLCLSSSTWSCTGLQLKANDGSFVNGRSVEFGIKLDLTGLVIPRHYAFQGTLPDGQPGIHYQSKYAVVGAGTFGADTVVDGLNEKGLAAGAFYFPDYAVYGKVTPTNKSKALSPTEFINWLLTQFASVDEVKQNLQAVLIAPTAPKGWGNVPPFHYIVYDTQGKSIVIEPINGQLKVYDNPIGIVTNSPTFDWQLTNLSNYINLSPLSAASVTIDGVKLQQFGQGSGLHGLPGDFTPPSRFIRAAIFATAAVPSDNAQQAVLQLFHILNQFDIPVGSVRSLNGSEVINEFTLATTVKNTQNASYYFRTFADQTIRMVNLNAFDLNSNQIKHFSMDGVTPVVDISKAVS